jgi:CDP-paratose 2-epimerase
MSCIYGPHQYGNEDQGWVAHFLIRTLDCIPVTIFGDGCQVRDILFADDLVDAMILAQQSMHLLSGQAFSIGGGPQNTISILELLDKIQNLHGHTPPIKFASWRSADQKYYVSDISNFSALTGWSPKVSINEGIKILYSWLKENKRPLIHCDTQPVPFTL